MDQNVIIFSSLVLWISKMNVHPAKDMIIYKFSFKMDILIE